MPPLPRYAVFGAFVMAISEVAMLLRIEPFWSWHTPIAWTGFILFADGLVWQRRGHSWIKTAPREFLFLCAASIPLWCVFEFFNLYIQNWHYINLPEQRFWRYFGYAWAFATIWPAIFEAGDLMAVWRTPQAPLSSAVPPTMSWTSMRISSVAAGAAMLLWPIVWPSPYLAAPVWLGFIALLDPLNARWKEDAFISDVARGHYDRLINLALGGLLCGFLWEFWNYWARAKWIYTVPIMADVKLFEMPLPGYLGFPAFALECCTMYASARAWLWRGPGRPISI